MLIGQTVQILPTLPTEKASEVVDFANYLRQQYEEYALVKGVTILNSQSGSFDLLEEEEELYHPDDLKEFFLIVECKNEFNEHLKVFHLLSFI